VQEGGVLIFVWTASLCLDCLHFPSGFALARQIAQLQAFFPLSATVSISFRLWKIAFIASRFFRFLFSTK